jgi:hypothetical protein
MNDVTSTTDPFDSYLAAKLGKPVAQVTAALDADDAYLDAMHAAQAGVCSHGGHGWDGDTCADIPVYSPEREAQAHADLIAALPRPLAGE